MSKCPHCKKEINYLKFERDVKQWGVIKADKDGDLEYLTDQPDDEITSDYFCPSCNTAIECDPEEFLKEINDDFQSHKNELIKALNDSKNIFDETCRDILDETIESVKKSINKEDIGKALKHLDDVVNFRLALMQKIKMSLVKDKILKGKENDNKS